MLALERNGDQVAGSFALSASRASMCSAMRRGRFLEFRIGAVCGIGVRGLTRALLGKAWRAGVGHPDLDGS